MDVGVNNGDEARDESMDHRATRTSDRLHPSHARLVLLAILAAWLAVGPAAVTYTCRCIVITF